jgi:hypothetical protein
MADANTQQTPPTAPPVGGGSSAIVAIVAIVLLLLLAWFFFFRGDAPAGRTGANVEATTPAEGSGGTKTP